MKAIVVFMAIVASASSQMEMWARAKVKSNTPANIAAGIFYFSQSNSTSEVLMDFVLFLEPALYVIAVHEGNRSITIDCNNLGKIIEIGPETLFDLVYIDAREAGFFTYIEDFPATSGTLVANQPDSLIGRVIAIYDGSTFELTDEGLPVMPSVACGYVTAPEAA